MFRFKLIPLLVPILGVNLVQPPTRLFSASANISLSCTPPIVTRVKTFEEAKQDYFELRKNLREFHCILANHYYPTLHKAICERLSEGECTGSIQVPNLYARKDDGYYWKYFDSDIFCRDLEKKVREELGIWIHLRHDFISQTLMYNLHSTID